MHDDINSQVTDDKNEYFKALFCMLGMFQLLVDSIREGNGLDCFLLQKMLLKIVYSTGHKNYACSMLSFKNIVLKHPNPQFSHKYMWNIFAGRCGPRLKCPRDMKNEHLNKFLKGGFRSLGVNLNEDTATRINNAADLGMELQDRVNAFFEIDPLGKSHSR